MIKKAKAACSSTIAVIQRLKINSWDIYCKLFKTLVRATLMHGSEIYAINHLEELEKVQLAYFKRLLNLAQNTPNYAIRLETDENYLSTVIFRNVLNWIEQILDMPAERYPRICFFRQLDLYRRDQTCNKYNWISLICELFFKPLGIDHWLVSNEFVKIKNEKESLLLNYATLLKNKDKNSAANSSTLVIYPEIKLLEKGVQKYLILGLSLKEVCVIAQIRLLNNKNCKLVYDKIKYDLDYCDHCHKCNKLNTIFHKLIDCEMYLNKRLEFLLPIKDNNNLDIFAILETPNLINCKNFIRYVLYIIKN